MDREPRSPPTVVRGCFRLDSHDRDGNGRFRAALPPEALAERPAPLGLAMSSYPYGAPRTADPRPHPQHPWQHQRHNLVVRPPTPGKPHASLLSRGGDALSPQQLPSPVRRAQCSRRVGGGIRGRTKEWATKIGPAKLGGPNKKKTRKKEEDSLDRANKWPRTPLRRSRLRRRWWG